MAMENCNFLKSNKSIETFFRSEFFFRPPENSWEKQALKFHRTVFESLPKYFGDGSKILTVKNVGKAYPNCDGFEKDPEKMTAEVKRRYSFTDENFLTAEESREWVFCMAMFLHGMKPPKMVSAAKPAVKFVEEPIDDEIDDIEIADIGPNVQVRLKLVFHLMPRARMLIGRNHQP